MARHTVSYVILLCFNEVFSKCQDFSYMRNSNEFIVVKNKSIQVNPECISGVLMMKKLDRSLFCMRKQSATKKSHKLNCFPEERSQESCMCGTENLPSLSTNRIMFPTGKRNIQSFKYYLHWDLNLPQ